MRFYSFLTLFALALLISACGNPTETMDKAEENATKAAEDLMAEAGKAMDDAPKLTPMPATKDFPDATITGWDYNGGKFTYETTGYEFAVPTPDADALMCANSGKGQHAHLIINNEPYIAKYEPTFEQDVPDGEHHILTFLSRSYHESIKTAQAHKAWKVSVKDAAFTSK